MDVMATIVTSALVGALVALFLSRVQWRREDRLRWAPDRRQSYSAFVAAVDRWENLDCEAAVNGDIEE